MVYKIEIPPEDKDVLHGNLVVDIEFWLNDYEDRDGTTKWYTECHTTFIPKGFVPLARMVDNPIELIGDLDGLGKFRCWLNEECDDGNRILPMEEADRRKSKVHHPELLRRIKALCDKYNLIYNVD